MWLEGCKAGDVINLRERAKKQTRVASALAIAAQVGNQLVGIAIAWGFALVGTLVILKITDLLTGFRVSEEHEVEGLDITQHGEEGYELAS